MMIFFLPICENQNPGIVGKSIRKRPLNFCLPEILVQTSSESKVCAKTNYLRIARRPIFMSPLRVWILQKLMIVA